MWIKVLLGVYLSIGRAILINSLPLPIAFGFQNVFLEVLENDVWKLIEAVKFASSVFPLFLSGDIVKGFLL